MTDLLTRMDAIQVHAAAAAAAANSKFVDVAVGFGAAKGRCVRIFYGGEREAEHFPESRTLNSQIVGQAIVVRGYWPRSDTNVRQQRLMEGEMGTFSKELRTRILGDSQLGGESVDLVMHMTRAEEVVLVSTRYAVTDTEIVVDFDEYTLAP